jgi:hypothetical protein
MNTCLGFDSNNFLNEYNSHIISDTTRGFQEVCNIVEAKKLDILYRSLLGSASSSLINNFPPHKLTYYPRVNLLKEISAFGKIKTGEHHGINELLRIKPKSLQTSFNGFLSHSIRHMYSLGSYKSYPPIFETLPVDPIKFHNIFSHAIDEGIDCYRIQMLDASKQGPAKFEPFPVKLHRLLLELDRTPENEGIVEFLPDGDSFEILDLSRFKDVVMKNYFPRMQSFASFQRQLNNYCFRRISNIPDRLVYHHPYFHREYPTFCIKIKRSIARMRNHDL